MRKRRLRGVKQTQKESGSFGKKKRKRERKGREGEIKTTEQLKSIKFQKWETKKRQGN